MHVEDVVQRILRTYEPIMVRILANPSDPNVLLRKYTLPDSHPLHDYLPADIPVSETGAPLLLLHGLDAIDAMNSRIPIGKSRPRQHSQGLLSRLVDHNTPSPVILVGVSGAGQHAEPTHIPPVAPSASAPTQCLSAPSHDPITVAAVPV